jgi:vacuolar-type H+-ATPase subunit F/Vma7
MVDLMVIVGPELATGFRLAGVKVHEATDGESVRSGVEHCLERSNKVGLLVIDEQLLATIPERLRDRAEQSSVPLGLPLPLSGDQDPEAQVTAVQEMVQSAIGFTIKLD